MSLDPILWAMKDAPVADGEERLILTYMAEAAHEDGCNSHQSQATIARLSMLSDRTVRKRLKDMEDRKLIARGDQSVPSLMRIPADRRPVNYDLMIPYSWFPRIGRINEYREHQGRPPITPEMRPDIADPPPQKRRRDLGVPRPKKVIDDGVDADGEEATGLQVPPDETGKATGVVVRPDSEVPTAGLQVPNDRTTTPTTLPLTLPCKPEEDLLLLGPELTEQDHAPSDLEEEADQQEIIDIVKVSRWFSRLRAHVSPDDEPWTEQDVETVLATAVSRGLGTLDLAAQALRKLVEGRAEFGPTRSPWRLLADTDPGCWAAVKPKTSAARRQLAAEPRCQTRGHGRQPVGRCVLCMSEKIAPVAEERPVLGPEAQAKAAAVAAAFLGSVRQRRQARAQGQQAGGVAAAS